MLPALVTPFHDPAGSMLGIFDEVLPDLKQHFTRMFLGVPAADWQTETVQYLQADDFFTLLHLEHGLPLGDRFASIYRYASSAADPQQVLHLCCLDRLAFVMCTQHREAFLTDVDALRVEDTPLLYHRSKTAWDTHPQNYFTLEGFITSVGETLFGKSLDYAWCHFAVRAGQLREVMALVRNHDLSVLAEILLALHDQVKVKNVDWLAWEDPFIFSRDAAELKYERENSLEEVQKRLAYVLPMVETLVKFAKSDANQPIFGNDR